MQQKKFLGLLLTLKKGATMTQRKKLIELIHEFGFSGYEINDLADYLLANGVVVLPCKVGDTVYRVFAPPDRTPVIAEFIVNTPGQAVDLVGCIGKMGKERGAFLTREEAEAALKKMEGEK